ncbi:TetR/AcrR family transcriptional regulator [Desulfuribacillus alkaliarsenatis]|uniref:AcrR family transcriptional regulator n=1 Tax=Desulfuribacillus alkaliarsenatis TaxID=766136 RepID=A0A1E5G147_9FIRM|nr:TetR/AcrR family transcriptional regulator [Desulfuribacillus alkaliarsenatis]OEF96632.1 AcrR family transcriptional regulator [Desulfuribacillus alkaliarsenatis]
MGNELDNIKQAEKILNAAFKCIEERGYANVSLRNIADEAGVVLSQLNYYYKNKEGLFTEVINTLAKQFVGEIEANLKKGASKKERIMYLTEYFQEMLRKKPEFFKMFYDITSMSLWSTSLKDIINDLFSNLANLIEKYILTDSNNNPSSIAIARIMLGTILGTSIQVLLAHEQEEIINTLPALELLFDRI